MKRHAIIPIFIPHRGCPNDCVFCNQRKITARSQAPTTAEVKATIDEWLTTLEPKRTCNGGTLEQLEVSFYGGSFTGLPIEEQSSYLAIAKEYLDAGRIDGIHLSTRPDYIDEAILANLKAYGVNTIEIGVQSFDDAVLTASNRGHNSAIVYRAADLIKRSGFRLGIQLMIGLPGDSMASCVHSAREAARLQPELARLYPTIVLDDTKLLKMYNEGSYQALSREEAIQRTLAMYRILDEAGIYIMRVGLKSTDIIGDGGAINGGTYHPAFRQLVEGRLMREKIEAQLESLLSETNFESSADSNSATKATSPDSNSATKATSPDSNSVTKATSPGPNTTINEKSQVYVYSNNSWYSNLIGNAAENRKYFENKYPNIHFHFRSDDSLADKEVSIRIQK